MDLYKWCYKLGPLVESELLFDCLGLAADARELDMRASPYDLRDFGFNPIAIETPAGRADYIRAQQDIAERAVPLRAAIADRCGELLVASRHRRQELALLLAGKLDRRQCAKRRRAAEGGKT